MLRNNTDDTDRSPLSLVSSGE